MPPSYAGSKASLATPTQKAVPTCAARPL